MASQHGSAEVLCVIQMFCEDSRMKMVRFPGGLLITPYHPVHLHGGWRFPGVVGEVQNYACNSVYNFVLSTGHTILVNNIKCVTLGHGLTDSVARHPYLGAHKVVQDLRELRNGVSFASGLICFGPNCLLRNASGQVCKFDASRQL